MLIRLIIAYILNLFDLGMTQYFISKYGISIESNPIGRWLFAHSILLLIWKLGLVAALLLVLYHFRNNRVANISSWIILGVYIALAIYHIILFIIIRRRI